MTGRTQPFGLVVTGEAEFWRSALEQIVGPQWLVTYKVRRGEELLKVVESGLADAAVLDDTPELGLNVFQLLRMIRRLNAMLPVVVVTGGQADRHMLESALRLTAFSVMSKPVDLEGMLRQLHRMMSRLDVMLRQNQGPINRG